MAKELDKENSKELSKTTLEKDEAKAKKDNEKKSLQAQAAKKPKKSIKKFFKDTKAEFKKVVWPSPKQVFNNTTVVLTSIVVCSLAIFGIDSLFSLVLRLVFKM